MNKIDRLAREINDIKSQIRSMNSPQLAYSALENGSIKEYDENGNLVSIIGKQIDGTHGHNVVAGPVPPAPADSGIQVEGGVGLIRVKWNGDFVDGNVAPLDFARMEVHVSETPSFLPDPLPNSATRAGTIEGAGGGEVAIVRTAGAYYVQLMTRALTGKHSLPSDEFDVVAEAVVSDAELQAIRDELAQANTDLDGLQVTLNGVTTDLANAQAELGTVRTDIDSALAEAQNAASEAAAASGLAHAASTEAAAATTAAQSAQDTADDASAEALAAAGLAGSKGEVIYQATAPTGSRAVAQNLWIRTTDNKPHTYNGTTWVAVTDKAATDAATAAAAAQSRADAAWNAANTAQGTANSALTAANGKNSVTYSLNAPGTAANTAGDIWFRRDSSGTITGQWEGLGGTSWASRTIGDQIIANLDAGKITSGYIDAARINAGTITVGMIKPGDVATPAQVNTAQQTATNDAKTYTDSAVNPINTTITLWKHPNATLIDGGKIYTDSITANQIAAGAITADEIAANAVIADKIAANAVTADKIVANAISADKIAANAISADKITANAITTDKIAANAVTAAEIKALSITTDKLAANAITADKIQAGAITAGKIGASAVTSDNIKAGAVTADKMVIGAGGNMIPWNPRIGPDPHLGWNSTSISGINDPDVGWCLSVVGGNIADGTRGTALRLDSGTISRSGLNGGFDVVPGRSYRFRMGIGIGGSFPSGVPRLVRLYVQYYDNAGVAAGSRVSPDWPANVFGVEIPYYEHQFDVPANAVAAYVYIQKTWWSTGSLFIVEPTLEPATDGSLIVNGTIETTHLKTGTLSASNIESGFINADIGIGTSGSLTVGATSGKHVLIGNGAITSLSPGATGLIPTISIGTASDAFGLVNSAGEYIGGIQADASIKTPELDADVIRLDGDDLAETLVSLPRGQVMYADDYPDNVGPYSSKTGVYEFPVEVEAGHSYLIQTTFTARSTTHAYYYYGLNYRFSTQPGGPGAPLVSSQYDTQLGRRVQISQGQATTVYGTTPHWWVYRPTATGTARFLFWVQQPSTEGVGQVQGAGLGILVTDIGVSTDNTGRPSLGGASGTTPDPTPPKKTYVKEYYLDSHEIWTQFGRGDTYAPQWVRSGKHSSFSSYYRTYMVLPAAARTALAGASSVSKIEVRLSQTSGFSGRPWFGTITTTNITTSEPTIYNAAQAGTTINTGQTKWIPLSAAQVNGLGPGASVGFVVGRGGTTAVTNQDFYGTSAGASVRPKVRITYTA